VIDWLSGATERGMIEGWVLVVLMPIDVYAMAGIAVSEEFS
jgi:hypothetical protein